MQNIAVNEQEFYGYLLEMNRKAFEQARREMFAVNDRYINRSELLKMFKIGAKQLEEWRQKGLKSVVIGRKTCFDLRDVYTLLEKEKN